jgi:hypothetical protein
MVGKLAGRQAEALAAELTELMYQLHAEWHRRAREAVGMSAAPGEVPK